MLFVFYGMDAHDGAEKRAAHYSAHRAHLESVAHYGVTIILSGPLTDDDGQTPIGSLIVIDAADRAAAENYFTHDPFYQAGVWEISTVTAFKKVKG